MAVGDFDEDGDLDIAVVDINERPSLRSSDGVNRQHWLAVEAVGTSSNRGGIGTRIRIAAGDGVQIGEVGSGGSYLSQRDPRVFFGLGSWTRVDQVEVRWPSGKVQRLAAVKADQVLTVLEESDADD